MGLPYSTEALREIQWRRRVLDKKLIWARQAQGVDEIKRRKKELKSMRSEFNAFSWKSRREWANKKVIDLQEVEELIFKKLKNLTTWVPFIVSCEKLV